MTEELKERESFELQAAMRGLDISMFTPPSEKEYRNPDTQSEWQGWKARAQLPSQGGEAVAWREHSVNYAKGEKCPETIETLQAAWDRDQELINGMRHEIARHKTRINRLEQRRPADQVTEPDAELVACLKFARTTMAVVADNANLRGVEYRSLITEIKRIDAKLVSLEVKQ